MHAQIPRMLEAGGGSIVNMASVLGQVGTAGASGYVAAKQGPGYIDTPLLENLPSDVRDALVGLHPIGRLGRSDEVSELVG